MEYLKAVFTLNVAEEDMDAAKDLLADLAAAAGFEAFEETDDKLVGYVQPQLLDKMALDEAIADFPIASASIAYVIVEAENRNWNEEWEANGFEPICIDGRCMIYDAQLLSMPLKGKRILDCGCGTGILGIVAAKLGADRVLGYDVDEWSVDNSLHNADLNGVQNMAVRKGDATTLNAGDGLFDVVVANINRNILLADMPRWVQMMAQGGRIVFSGFYQTDIPMLVEAAADLGLRLISEREQENWACLTFCKE